ncbi:hypothetical protein VTO42DRAFT_6610 [Malbranchea cinnamomea]
MHLSLAVGAMLAASISAVSANSCISGTAQNLGGNWYCSAVESIKYTNFGSSGTYNEITSINGGSCTSKPRSYSGPLAPLNEEHSFHFRGPLHLKQFAVYTPGSGILKRDLKPSFRERRHGHNHLHRRAPAEGSDKLQFKVSDPEDAVPIPSAAPSEDPAPAPAPTPDNSEEHEDVGLFGWTRKAYYNAEKGIADGLVFLNHHGGDGSGVFDYELGMSLSYASSNGLRGAASPQVLEDVLLPDNEEIVIMSDRKCDGDCGAVRPGTVAYHGFDGASKLYLLELSMPLTGKTGFNMDMPAAWILNAQIPRTLQYGKAECSCWKTGCGEFDVLEVLDSGNTRCKSTLHGNISGGDSHYFNRPTDGPIKVAVFFHALTSSVHIKILDSDYEFSSSLSGAKVAKLAIEAAINSIFNLGS